MHTRVNYDRKIRWGVDSGFRREDGCRVAQRDSSGDLRMTSQGSVGEGIQDSLVQGGVEEFYEVAGAAGGSVFELLAAGDAGDGDFPVVVLGFDLGEKFLGADGH